MSKTIFPTRKSAAADLATKGWQHTANSFGDWVFTHPVIRTHYNMLIQLRNGKWRVEAWEITGHEEIYRPR